MFDKTLKRVCAIEETLSKVKDDIIPLKKAIGVVDNKTVHLAETTNSINKKITCLEDRIKILLDEFRNANERRLIEFHKEITERYFETLDKIFRFNKEISLIDTLARQTNDKDFALLKSAFMQPVLQARWDDKRKKDGAKILSKGEEIILKQKELHKEILEKEKAGENVALLREQLKAYNQILEMIK